MPDRPRRLNLAMILTVSRVPINPTAQLFTDDPPSFYYAYDGHLNRAGSARIAEMLISQASHSKGR